MIETNHNHKEEEEEEEEEEAPSNTTTDGVQSGSLYVVTDDGEECCMWRSNQLTYIAQDRAEIPQILATKFGPLATRLDLSYNSLTSFKYINQFTCLTELILDNNQLEDEHLDFRLNLRLKTLSLNKNKLANLCQVIKSIRENFNNLQYLSLIGNPLCPGPMLAAIPPPSPKEGETSELIQDATATALDDRIQFDHHHHHQSNVSSDCPEGQQKYRHFIIYHLANLRFLDSSPVTRSERDEALRRCFWMSQEAHTNRTTTEEGAPEQDFQLTIMSGNTSDQQPRGVFSRLAYKYTGRNSEGNRFITNVQL